MVLTWNKSPSRDISYLTLEQDEKKRASRSVTIPKAERRTIFDSKRDENQNLNAQSSQYKNGTPKSRLGGREMTTNIKGNRRGGFQNNQLRIAGVHYYAPSSARRPRMSLVDHADALPVTIMAMKSKQPRCLSPYYYRGKDVREYAIKSQFAKPIGPGDYDVSGGGEYRIGLRPGSTSYTPAKDPERPSRAFLSPERQPFNDRVPTADYYSPTVHQFKHWTSKGLAVQVDDRVISPERWGQSYREPRNPKTIPDTFYDSQINKQGDQAEMGVMLDNRPHSAFQTTEPRLATLPKERTTDVRLVQGRYSIDRMYASGVLGPGTYIQDQEFKHSPMKRQPQQAPKEQLLKVPVKIRRLPYTNEKKYLRVVKDLRDTRLKYRLSEAMDQGGMDNINLNKSLQSLLISVQ